MKAEVTYLLNSGFLVRVGRTLLVFDDFEDEQDFVGRALRQTTEYDAAYLFASHAHFDHFDEHILSYQDVARRYVFGYDIRRTKRGRKFPQDKVTYMKPYELWEDENIKVESYDSTDIGVAFRVTEKKTGAVIFHAGDFNWWDWTGESAENRKLAENAFRKQLKRLEGMKADLAFFPVDGRLGPMQDKGVRAFIRVVDIGALITMHDLEESGWKPGADFFPEGKHFPVWSPAVHGDKKLVEMTGGITVK